jgi:endoglucanase
MLLMAWEDFEPKLASLTLDIPESNNGVPDFLDEARWELEWLLKMQSADGSVYHKISTRKFGAFIKPEAEHERRYFSPWSSGATADFVAILARAARAYREIDPPFAERCLTAAKRSYEFLGKHVENHPPDLSAFEISAYVAPDPDDRLWAAAEIWESTGDKRALDDFESRLKKIASVESSPVIAFDWDWSNVRNLGAFTYLRSKRSGRNAELAARVRKDAVRVADQIVERAGKHPFGRPLGEKYYWGSNGAVARQAINLNVAFDLTKDVRYRAAMLIALDYLFGRNDYGRSYVTGLGDRPPLHPHDRRSGADANISPWPGYLVGGPWPGARDWVDDQENYKTNEIAINWNGALIYALAAFVEPESFDESIKIERDRKNGRSGTQP